MQGAVKEHQKIPLWRGLSLGASDALQSGTHDHEEMHLSCGDSFYDEGDDGMPIIFPSEGNLIEWVSGP